MADTLNIPKETKVENWKLHENRVGVNSVLNSLNKIESSVVDSGSAPEVLEEIHKTKTHFYREYFANARIYKNAVTNQADFRSETEAKKVLDPESFSEAEAASYFRYNRDIPYPENCRKKTPFLQDELALGSNKDLILRRINALKSLAETFETPLDLPLSVEFRNKMSKVVGFENFIEEIVDYLITVKFYQASGAVVPQQYYCLLGAPGIGKSYISGLIAHALGKQFININCATANISELIGIAQDYTGKDFGKIAKMMIEGKDRSPFILFDEIDKCKDAGVSNAISVLFDATKNQHEFEDIFFQFPIPMNECFFICTANYRENLENFVQSRCTFVDLEPLTFDQRMTIARMEVIKNLKESNRGLEIYGDLSKTECRFSDTLLQKTLTPEWGVRGIVNNCKAMCKRWIKLGSTEDGNDVRFNADEPDKDTTNPNSPLNMPKTVVAMENYDWGFKSRREFGQVENSKGKRVATCNAGYSDYDPSRRNPDGTLEKPPHRVGCECFFTSKILGWETAFNGWGEPWVLPDWDVIPTTVPPVTI